MLDDVFRYEPYEESEITVVALDDGGVQISVTDEHAMDSYNEIFENDITLPLEEARKLRDWLNANVKDVSHER